MWPKQTNTDALMEKQQNQKGIHETCDQCSLIPTNQSRKSDHSLFFSKENWWALMTSIGQNILFPIHYENTPIQIYWKFYHQKMKIFR